MDNLLTGKSILITGAGSGIGQASALVMAEQGAKIVVSDVNVDGGNETVEKIKAAGGEAVFVQCDVSKAAEVEALVKATVDAYGVLDGAFNNAGVEGAPATTINCTEENFDFNYNVNMKGVWLCMKYEILQMLAQGAGQDGKSGAIVNTASVAGLVGAKGLPAYVAAKHGVVGLTKTAALEFATKNIRVNAVCPGGIRTPMLQRGLDKNPKIEKGLMRYHPIGRLGDPAEVGRNVAWLLSDGASFVTGHALPVDGGCTAA